jgi:uncharacterized protein
MSIAAFAPFETLAEQLLPHATAGSADGSHDLSHLLRVWKNARAIQSEEGGDTEILAAATMLHDCVAAEKNSPHRTQASQLAAAKASELLAGMGW